MKNNIEILSEIIGFEITDSMHKTVSITIEGALKAMDLIKYGPDQEKKEEFINKVSKINETGEDEFKAEFNSPELLWEGGKQDLKKGVFECMKELEKQKYKPLDFVEETGREIVKEVLNNTGKKIKEYKAVRIKPKKKSKKRRIRDKK